MLIVIYISKGSKIFMNYNNSNNYDGYTLHEETRKAFMRLIIYCTVGWAMIMAGFGLALGNSSSFLGVILILGGPIIIAIPFLNKLHGGLNLAALLAGTYYVTNTTYSDGTQTREEDHSNTIFAILIYIICVIISILIMLVNLIKGFVQCLVIKHKYGLSLSFRYSVWFNVVIQVVGFLLGIGILFFAKSVAASSSAAIIFTNYYTLLLK